MLAHELEAGRFDRSPKMICGAIPIEVSVKRANPSVMHGKLDLHFLHFIPLGNKMATLEEVSKEGRESSESGGKFLGGFQV